MLRSWGVLYILTSKCASRHNGVHLFISHLARWLRAHRFSEPSFRLSGATNHGENTVLRALPSFSRTCTFFLLILSLLWSSLLLFSFLTLPTSAFPFVHIVGSLTSTLFICIYSEARITFVWIKNTFLNYLFVIYLFMSMIQGQLSQRVMRCVHWWCILCFVCAIFFQSVECIMTKMGVRVPGFSGFPIWGRSCNRVLGWVVGNFQYFLGSC